MEKNTEIVKSDLNDKQIKSLVDKLSRSGFYVSKSGHVAVEKPKDTHPKWGWGIEHYLPVGFIGNDYAELINLEEKFPEDYHGQLRDIYRSV